MPILKIETNITVANKDRILARLSSFTADLLGKSEAFVMIIVEDQKQLLFGGSNAPSALIRLTSLDMDMHKSRSYAIEICNEISDLTGIDAKRLYIQFESPERNEFAWNKKTFEKQ